MTLLALDLSTTCTGYCLWRTPHDLHAASVAFSGTLPARLAQLGKFLETGIQYLSWRPDLVLVETPDHTRHSVRNTAATLKALYEALGVVREVCRTAGVAVREVSPQLVRERIAGSPSATKRDVQICLERRGFTLPLFPSGKVDHDAVDALALCVMVADEMALIARAEVTR